MNNVYFGIIIGIFLCFAGQRFIVVATKAWERRKEDEARKEAENMEMIVNRVAEKINKGE